MPVLVYVWGFLGKHWRPALAVALLVGSFLAGRFSGHRQCPAAVTQTTVADKHETTDTHAKVDEKKTEQTDKEKVVEVKRHRVRHPDGTVETDTDAKETVGTKTKVADNTESKTDEHTETVEHVLTKTVVTPAPAPNWFVGAELGVPVALKKPFVGTPFVVLHVDRRVWGPFQAGLWGSLDVKGQNPAVGFSVGVSF